MTLDTGSLDDGLTAPVARPSRGALTPRLMAADPGATQAVSNVTVANIRLPEAQVHARASALVENSRAMGASHTLRIWREAHEEALRELAREASGVGAAGSCEALFWDRDESGYHVSATFAQPTVH